MKRETKSTKPAALVVKCSNCQWATLVQYRKDPLLAECAMKEPEEREIAETIRTCPLFIESQVKKTIIHR